MATHIMHMPMHVPPPIILGSFEARRQYVEELAAKALPLIKKLGLHEGRAGDGEKYTLLRFFGVDDLERSSKEIASGVVQTGLSDMLISSLFNECSTMSDSIMQAVRWGNAPLLQEQLSRTGAPQLRQNRASPRARLAPRTQPPWRISTHLSSLKPIAVPLHVTCRRVVCGPKEGDGREAVDRRACFHTGTLACHRRRLGSPFKTQNDQKGKLGRVRACAHRLWRRARQGAQMGHNKHCPCLCARAQTARPCHHKTTASRRCCALLTGGSEQAVLLSAARLPRSRQVPAQVPHGGRAAFYFCARRCQYVGLRCCY